MKRGSSASVLASLLLLTIMSPLATAAVSVSLSASPTAQEATTDDDAEYDIIVTNDGDEDISVTLSTQQGNDCNGFSSSLDSYQVSVDEGTSETVVLTVSVNDQADGDSETTVGEAGAGSPLAGAFPASLPGSAAGPPPESRADTRPTHPSHATPKSSRLEGRLEPRSWLSLIHI